MSIQGKGVGSVEPGLVGRAAVAGERLSRVSCDGRDDIRLRVDFPDAIIAGVRYINVACHIDGDARRDVKLGRGSDFLISGEARFAVADNR